MFSLLKKVFPFFMWGLSGTLAVLVDLALLFVLVELTHMHYLPAAVIAFLTSASLNYTISGLAIFRNAQHSLRRSYITFMCISLIGLGAITISMFILVEIFNVHYLVSRILLAGTLGLASFFLHKYLSFKDILRSY